MKRNGTYICVILQDETQKRGGFAPPENWREILGAALAENTAPVKRQRAVRSLRFRPLLLYLEDDLPLPACLTQVVFSSIWFFGDKVCVPLIPSTGVEAAAINMPTDEDSSVSSYQPSRYME